MRNMLSCGLMTFAGVFGNFILSGEVRLRAEEAPAQAPKPAVEITRPRENLKTITPVAKPVIGFSVNDQSNVSIAFKIERKDPPKGDEKTIKTAEEHRIPMTKEMEEHPAGRPQSVEFDLSKYNLAEGDKVTYWLEVSAKPETPNGKAEDKAIPIAKSSERQFKVVSKKEKAEELNAEIANLNESLQAMKNQQDDLKKKVRQIIEEIQKELEKNK